jgi:hypothetical protein
MTTTDPKVLHSRSIATEQAVRGVQAPLIVVEVPAGAEAMIGKPIGEQTLSINGDYVCLIPIAGLASSLKVSVLPQLTTATLTSAGPDELNDFNPRVTNVAAATVLTAGTGDGALSDNTVQTASLTPTGGIYARYTLTVASAGTVTFDLAAYVGL